VQALNGFDLELPAGSILGLIGPNGSGKTTALKAFLGLCPLDGGEVRVLGRDPARERKALMSHVGYIADVGILPRWMRVRQLLDFVEGVHPRFDREQALATLAGGDVRLDARIAGLSKGMGVQLHLAVITALGSDLLVLDEPTLGLDILHRQRFYDTLLGDWFSAERGILITTHEVREIEHLLTHVVFIHHGRAVLQAALSEIHTRFSRLAVSGESAAAARALGPIAERPSAAGVQLIFDGADREALAKLGDVAPPTLPELFVALLSTSEAGLLSGGEAGLVSATGGAR
jgi:ABC-2 type transport system ATP-binding protein